MIYSYHKELTVSEIVIDSTKTILPDYSQEEIIKFVEEFYLFVAKDSIHDRFLFPAIEKKDNVYQLNLENYLKGLRESIFFTDSYIKKDSLLLISCVKCFNSKKYTIDLEGSFLDECQVCYDTDFNRLTGMEDYFTKFKWGNFIQSGKKYAVFGNCITKKDTKGNKLRILLDVDQFGKLKIDRIEKV